MLRYYSLTGTKAADDNANYRKIFLGEFAHPECKFRDEVEQFLRSMGAHGSET
jgi:hypothetical protein